MAAIGMTYAEHNRRYREAKTAWQRAKRAKETPEQEDAMMSMDAVAQIFGITRARVWQIERSAIRKLWQGRDR
jgi:hypothetical protein